MKSDHVTGMPLQVPERITTDLAARTAHAIDGLRNQRAAH